MQTTIQNPIYGLDVSQFQGSINWQDVKSSGKEFVLIRAAYSNTLTDPEFENNYMGAKKAGLKVGAWHFVVPTGNAIQQAQYFAHLIKGKDWDYLPCIDIETNPNSGQSATAWLNAYADELHSILGIYPGLYSNPAYLTREGIQKSNLYSVPYLWIADWNSGTVPNIAGFDVWNIHQFSCTGHVNGISGNVCMDMLDGDLESSVLWLSQQSTPSTPSIPSTQPTQASLTVEDVQKLINSALTPELKKTLQGLASAFQKYADGL